MATISATQQPTNNGRGTPDPSLLSAVEFWWVGIPSRVVRYSRVLAAAWADGLYLTSWPQAALAVPLGALLVGFFEGATHWSPLTISSTHISTAVPAVAFLQILHLLFLAVIVGAISANAGLMLVAGFALGDYLIAGSYMTQWDWAPITSFLTVRVPMLYSYFMFFALAVMPTLAGSALVAPLLRKVPRDGLFWVILRIAASAAVQMLIVYCWVGFTPIVMRVMWSWVHQIPILGMSDYRDMLSPWLPLAAGAGVVVRAILVRRAGAREALIKRMVLLLHAERQAARNPGWTRRLPVALRAVFTGLGMALLLAGLVSTWWLAGVVCAAAVSLSLLRNCALPASAQWRRWTETMDRIPALFRIIAMSVASYYLSLGMLQLPGWSTRSNSAPGHFETVLGCLGAGLLIAIVLIPYRPEASGEQLPTPFSIPAGRAARAAGAFLMLYLLINATPAYAICEDPSCCFGFNSQEATAIAVGLFAVAVMFGGVWAGMYLGYEAGLAAAAAAAEAEEAAAAAAAAEQAAAAAAAEDAAAAEALGLADTGDLGVTAPGFSDTLDMGLAPQGSPLANSVSNLGPDATAVDLELPMAKWPPKP
jgi:hypothetical protein